jgi:hypothetical protein
MEDKRVADQYATNMGMKEAVAMDEEGNPLYPEINQPAGTHDPQAMQMIVNEWARLRGINSEFAHSSEGIKTAVNNFRTWAYRTNYKPASQKAAETETIKEGVKEVVRGADGRFQSKQKARNDAASGGGSTPPVTPDSTPQSLSEAEQRRRIRNAGRKNNSDQDRKARSIFGVS